ncbi:MAG: SDR family NAD(P)-dependent oxidoreductase [Spirochaetes bacterium]|nr:MAG: SDR family NAD(P)-dependent oxidoreductase [Spirochaetota bacterium]
MKTLTGKNVVITGAAAGIGRLMALNFAREKANIALIDIDRRRLEETERECTALKVKARSYVCDVSSKKMVDGVAKEIRKEFDRIDILVNNAGVVAGKPFLDLSYEDVKRTMDINFMGTIILTQAFLPAMVVRNDGHIVNIASSAGFLGMPNLSDYCASKFAEVGFTDSLRLELKKFGHTGVKLTCVCPYVISTGMFKGFKPFIFNPVLTPEYVAARVLQGVKKDKAYVVMPFMVRLIKYVKLFPVGIQDWIVANMGANRAMDTFKGK